MNYVAITPTPDLVRVQNHSIACKKLGYMCDSSIHGLLAAYQASTRHMRLVQAVLSPVVTHPGLRSVPVLHNTIYIAIVRMFTCSCLNHHCSTVVHSNPMLVISHTPHSLYSSSHDIGERIIYIVRRDPTFVLRMCIHMRFSVWVVYVMC